MVCRKRYSPAWRKTRRETFAEDPEDASALLRRFHVGGTGATIQLQQAERSKIICPTRFESPPPKRTSRNTGSPDVFQVSEWPQPRPSRGAIWSDGGLHPL